MRDLKAGIFIIGSLLWDDDGARPGWRDDRLVMPAKQRVRTHTRYGRISRSRHETYTMVFSESAGASTAVVVPCSRLIRSAEDLLQEAGQLARAEGLGSGAKWSSFGAVGILINPKSTGAACFLPTWSQYFQTRLNDDCNALRSKARGEQPSLREDGVLNVSWPMCEDSAAPNDCDILLATANAPDLNADATYPSPAQIARCFLAKRYITYFAENVLHGIVTADDNEIWRDIKALESEWIEPALAERIDAVLSRVAR